MPRAARDVCTVTAPSCSVRGARRYVTLVERGRIVEPSSVMVDSFTRFLTAFLYSSWCRRRHLWSQSITCASLASQLGPGTQDCR